MPIGYRVVSYDIATLSAKTLMDKRPVDLSIGSKHEYEGGVYLGTSRGFCDYYTGCTEDADLILTFEFDEADIARGDLTPNSEVLLKKAILKGVAFDDKDLARIFSHHFDPSSIIARRESLRGQSLAELEGGKRVSLVRAMDARSNHLNPMDFVYLTDGLAPHSAAKRALKAYEDGLRPRSNLELAIKKALEHAVTTAIYENEPQKVTFANLGNRFVYKAPNEGEHFYDAEKPFEVTTLLEVSADGEVMLAKPSREAEVAASL